MTPLGWGWALVVWGYALAWFLVSDRVKLLAYHFIDPVKATSAAGVTPRLAMTSSDLGPQIAKVPMPCMSSTVATTATQQRLARRTEGRQGESSKQRTPRAQEGQKDDL